MNKTLFVSSEAFPLIKTGGLGDVAGSLPPALHKLSQDIRLLLPAYPEVLKKVKHHKVVAKILHYGIPGEVLETRLPGTKVLLYLVSCPELYNRTGGPYVDQDGEPWHDNAIRFAYLCYTAVDIALNKLSLQWQPELVHCHDWQTGLIPALLSLASHRPATLFTIHNLAYQGVFDHLTFKHLELPDELWHMDGVEFYGQLSFMKAGLAYSDQISAVSPTYAKEILNPDNGYGMDGLLTHRSDVLTGILNGIDTRYWNPGTDNLITEKYNRRSLDKKMVNKTALQDELMLPVNPDLPMIGMISRLVNQKGLDWILQCMPDFLKLPVQMVFLGTGEHHYEKELSRLAAEHPYKIATIIGYDESLSHRIEAASNIYLMPSIFEPCGLNQLYSLRYGTLPVVNPVGGLADSVTDTNPANLKARTANGFVMQEHSAASLLKTVKRAVDTYADQEIWQQLQHNAMSCDFSWHVSAQQYLELYEKTIASL